MAYDIHNQELKRKGSFTHRMVHPSGLVCIFKHEGDLAPKVAGLLREHCDVNMIVELGTFQGGFTKHLEDAFPEIPIYSYDNVDLIKGNRQYYSDRVVFRVESVLTDCESLLVLLNNPLVKLLYCDNGKKKQEVAMYSQYLFHGDFIAVHDWGNEIFWEDVQPYIGDWERIAWDQLEGWGSTTRLWRKP